MKSYEKNMKILDSMTNSERKHFYAEQEEFVSIVTSPKSEKEKDAARKKFLALKSKWGFV